MTIGRRQQVLAVIKKAFPDYPCFFGFDFIPELRACIASGAPFIYGDHAYFGRGYENQNFRIIVSDIHQTKIRQRDKPKTFQVQPVEWRRGSHILVFPPSQTIAQTFDAGMWAEETCREILRHTDRKVIIKTKQHGDLGPYLRNAHAVVGYGTVASVEAVMAGVPVFCGPHCPATPIGLKDLSQIESPSYGDTQPWINSLTWSQFHLDEIRSGLCRETLIGAG